VKPSEKSGNLFRALSAALRGEQVDVLAETAGLRIERIISRGQITPPGQWYDGARDEWVAVLAGAARLRFEGRRHRARWRPATGSASRRTRGIGGVDGSERATVWLAVHFDAKP